MTNYLKLPGSIPRGPTISTCSTVCFRYIKFVASAFIYKEKRFIYTALHYIYYDFLFNFYFFGVLIFHLTFSNVDILASNSHFFYIVFILLNSLAFYAYPPCVLTITISSHVGSYQCFFIWKNKLPLQISF